MLVSLTTLGHGLQTSREWGIQATPSFALFSRILNIMTKEIIECTFYKIKNISYYDRGQLLNFESWLPVDHKFKLRKNVEDLYYGSIESFKMYISIFRYHVQRKSEPVHLG